MTEKVEFEKYLDLFIEHFKVDKLQLENEFNRVINIHGNTDDIKIQFFSKIFESVVEQYKFDLKSHQEYCTLISEMYKKYIGILKEDGIDTTKYVEDYKLFLTENNTSNKKFNLNTKYGRRKAREQAERNYQNGTIEHKQTIDKINATIFIVLFATLVLIVLIKTKIL